MLWTTSWKGMVSSVTAENAIAGVLNLVIAVKQTATVGMSRIVRFSERMKQNHLVRMTREYSWPCPDLCRKAMYAVSPKTKTASTVHRVNPTMMYASSTCCKSKLV